MAATEEAQAARQATLDALEERIVRSVEALVSGGDWRRAIEFAARFRTRSFNNTLLIWAQHLEAYEQGRVPTPTPTWVAGYNDWRKMGRWPEKDGGYRIRGPVKARFASATSRDPASWRRLGSGRSLGRARSCVSGSSASSRLTCGTCRGRMEHRFPNCLVRGCWRAKPPLACGRAWPGRRSRWGSRCCGCRSIAWSGARTAARISRPGR